MDSDSPYRKAARRTLRNTARALRRMPSSGRILQLTVALLTQLAGVLCMGVSPAPFLYALSYGVAVQFIVTSVFVGLALALIGFLLIGFGTHLEWL